MLDIRRAEQADSLELVRIILSSFESDFSLFTNYFGQYFVLDFLEDILIAERFYVAELEGQILGLLAFSDSAGRATYLDRRSLGRKYGRLRVFLLGLVLRDFTKQLPLADQTAYLEYVAVREDCRGQGIASQLIEKSMKLAAYSSYLLEVKDSNSSAIRCYQGLGFREIKRKRRSIFYPGKDFKNWIWMERKSG